MTLPPVVSDTEGICPVRFAATVGRHWPHDWKNKTIDWPRGFQQVAPFRHCGGRRP